jgi:autotransporter-associated beta strand protein
MQGQNAIVNNGTTAQIGPPPPSLPPPSTTAAFADILTITGNPTTGAPSTVVLTSGFSLAVTTLSIGNGGTFHLVGALTVSNPVEIGVGGTFQASAGGTKNTKDFHNNGTFLADGSNSLVSNVSGTGQLVITGTGTVLTVSSALNTYSGATTINTGAELVAASATGLSPNSPFILNSTPATPTAPAMLATLDIHGFNSTVGSLSGNGTVLNNGAGTATLSIGNDGTNTTFNGVLADGTSALVLTKIGAGTLTLTGINTYSGGTNINGGTLAVNSDSNLGAGPLTFDGGTLEALTGITSAKTITLNAGGGTFLADPGTVSTLNGAISGAGSLTKTGTGILVLAGVNAYTGGTNVSSGTLQAGSATGFSPNSEFTVNSILDLHGFNSTIGSLSGTGIVLNNGATAATLTAGNDNSNSTFSGILEDGTSVLGLTKSGTGTLVLTGTNTYTGGTTISAGTLQAGSTTGFSPNSQFTVNSILDLHGFNNTIGSLSGTGSVLNNGTTAAILTVGNGNSTFSGILENGTSVLGLTKSGTGTLVLTGANTYTGGTTISAGTLQAGSTTGFSPNSQFTVNSILDLHGFNNTIGSLSGTGIVLNNGATAATLTAGNDNGNSTFSGILEDGTSVLGLTKSGTGTLVLTGANTYTGGTTISAGTLQAGSATGFSPNSEFTVNSILDLHGFNSTIGSLSGTGIVLNNGATAATLTAGNDNGNSTFSGVLSDGKSVLGLTKSGTGTLVLTGANTYTGGTTVSAGTLQIGNGGTTGSIVGKVIDNGVLVFDRSDSVTFGGVISGTGNLIQQGTGVLTLPRANTYTGTTTVNSGSLIVDGSIASQHTFVSAGGLLGGHGTIGGDLGGDLINNGIVGQLNSPGTLTVNGNYIQTAGGTLRIGVGGLAPNQHDLLEVNGHVTLGGTLQIVPLGSFSLQPGNQIEFITAGKGVSGTFGTVQTGTIVQGVVVTQPNAVLLEGQQGSFTQIPGVTLTPNQLAVGNMLNSAVGNPAAAPLIAFLNSQPVANLPNDYNLIAPTQISSVNATAVSVGRVQATNIGGRTANIRAGLTGFSSAGFGISGGAASFGEGFEGVSGPEGKSGPPALAPTPSNRWGVFLTGLGEFTNVDSTPNAPGYDVNTGGFTLGVDYRLTPNFALGLSAGYAHTSVGIDSPGGNIDVNAGTIGMYATVFGNGFYLDTAVNGGPSGYTTRRTALQGTANGSTNGGEFNFLVAGGYDWTKGNLTIGPTASFQYGYVALDGFTETGSLAPLTFPRQNTESERTAFGAKANYEWKIGNITAIPQFSAAWQHEFGSTEYAVVASLASGAGNSFTVHGPNIGRDSLLIGAGATVILNERVSTYLYYDGEFARTNYLSNNVTGGVRISF